MNAALPTLRPYQVEVCRAVLDSVRYRKGLTFSVEIARQGGKNELSAQMEVFLLTLFARKGGNLVKCSPTFRPQTLTSVIRLEDRLNNAGFHELWQRELGYMIRLGRARQIFLSADGSSHVVGATAHVLMELDESQDIAKEKYSKDFKPMGASTNVTTVLYGTTWDDSSLLEEVKQVNLELERKDGVKRHFHFDWEHVAEHNSEYRSYVDGERQRLGENHPLFMTQYRLLPVSGGGRFFSADQKAQMLGRHDRTRGPVEGRVYVPASTWRDRPRRARMPSRGWSAPGGTRRW